MVRQQRRNTNWLSFTDTLPESETAPADADAALDAETVAQSLSQALQKLTPEHRMVMVLRYYDQLSVQEIGEKLECSVGTVKSRLFHARQQMSVLVPKSLNPFATERT